MSVKTFTFVTNFNLHWVIVTVNCNEYSLKNNSYYNIQISYTYVISHPIVKRPHPFFDCTEAQRELCNGDIVKKSPL